VIGKMLACAEPEVARLAIGPAHPVFYGPVTGLRVDSEIIADGDEALHDIVIGQASA
jgi:hypothetical protein